MFQQLCRSLMSWTGSMTLHCLSYTSQFCSKRIRIHDIFHWSFCFNSYWFHKFKQIIVKLKAFSISVLHHCMIKSLSQLWSLNQVNEEVCQTIIFLQFVIRKPQDSKKSADPRLHERQERSCFACHKHQNFLNSF